MCSFILNMSQHVSVWRILRRGSLKCGGEHYLKKEHGQRYRISHLEDNGGRFLLRRVDRYYCTRVYYLENAWRHELLRSMNYYIQHNEALSYKKRVSFSFFIYFFQHLIVYSFYNLSNFFLSYFRYTPHILGRRFALTATSYKYVDIGISMRPMSSVEIVIGDNRGNQIILLHATWEMFIERRANIEQFLQSPAPSSLAIQDLTVELVKIYDINMVKIW